MREVVTLDTGTQKDFMNRLVIKSGDYTAVYGHSKFSMPKRIFNTCCFSILVYALACCSIEFLAVWRKSQICRFVQSCLTNLHASAMCLVGDCKDVNQFCFKGGIVLHMAIFL